MDERGFERRLLGLIFTSNMPITAVSRMSETTRGLVSA